MATDPPKPTRFKIPDDLGEERVVGLRIELGTVRELMDSLSEPRSAESPGLFAADIPFVLIQTRTATAPPSASERPRAFGPEMQRPRAGASAPPGPFDPLVPGSPPAFRILGALRPGLRVEPHWKNPLLASVGVPTIAQDPPSCWLALATGRDSAVVVRPGYRSRRPVRRSRAFAEQGS